MSTLPTTPCVSVVIPLFNAGTYIEQAIESALAQPEALEVIVVDDGSTDDGLARCRALAIRDPLRVLVVAHPDERNHGAGASRNLGIRHARGDLVAFLDADDYFLPGRFSRGVPQLLAEPDLDGIYEAVETAFETPEARRAWGVDVPTLITLPENVPPHELPHVIASGAGNFCTDGVLLRRHVFDNAGFFDTDLPLGQDVALWWRLAVLCRLAGGRLDRPVAIYRRHAGNRSGPLHPDFRRTRLAVAAKTWEWARRVRCEPEHLRVLKGAYGRALADWDAGGTRECLRLMTSHLIRSPQIAFGLGFWAGLTRRLLRKTFPSPIGFLRRS